MASEARYVHAACPNWGFVHARDGRKVYIDDGHLRW